NKQHTLTDIKTPPPERVYEEERKQSSYRKPERTAYIKTEQKVKHKSKPTYEQPRKKSPSLNSTERSDQKRPIPPQKPQESQRLHDPKGYYKILGLDYLTLVPDDDIIKIAFSSTLKKIEGEYVGHMHLPSEERREKDEKIRKLIEARNALIK
ncbi:2398_t:CDS:1, partial [Acaulospora morrowiae]